jgi:hypothetical protein
VTRIETWRRRLLATGWILGGTGFVVAALIFANLLLASLTNEPTALWLIGGNANLGIVLMIALTAISLGCDAFIVRGRLEPWSQLPRRARPVRVVGLSLAMLAVGAVSGFGFVAVFVFGTISLSCSRGC